jgi:hypothetical protein
LDKDTSIMTLRVALSDQCGGEPRSSEYNGSKALLMAVLEGGIRDYCGAHGLRCTAEATAWVHSGRREAFSFAVVCEALGLEPEAVRHALERLKRQGAFPSTRSRQNVRNQKLTAESR